MLDRYRASNARTWFNRAELSQLLGVYSVRVARGEWRDYAIDHREGMAVFSIYRHSAEAPLFSIVKFAGRGRNPCDYAIIAGQQRLRRASRLSEVLEVIRSGNLKLVSG